ncbi:hypothetical protein BGC_23600 [Burkholderia sp. 3C]
MKQKLTRFFSGFVLIAVTVGAHAQGTSLGVTVSGVSAPIPVEWGGTGATTAVGATGQLQYSAPFSGAVPRSLTNKFQDTLNLKDFGATCNGTGTGDETALTNAFAALAPGLTLTLPAGTCVFTTAKVLPVISNAGIVGAGSGQTVLLYTGSDTANDLIKIGNGTASLTGWLVKGFSLQSNTKMTGGAALHMMRMQNGNRIEDVNVGMFGASTNNLHNGVWLDNVNVFKYDNFSISVQNEGLMMNGSATSSEGSDIFLDNGSITFSAIGYHVGGGQGGIYFGKVLAFGNGVNFQIDNLLAAQKNREIFFSDLSVSDGSSSYGVWFNDSLTSNAPVVMNGAYGSAGLIGPMLNVAEIYVEKWPNGRISMGPGQLYNATGDGLLVDDTSTQIAIDPSRYIFNNTGYGINATSPDSQISNLSQFMQLNGSGNYSPNVHLTPFSVASSVEFGSSVSVASTLSVKSVSGTSSLTIDNAGMQQSVVLFNDTGSNKWQLGENINDHFFAYDTSANKYVWDMPSGGPLTVTPMVAVAGGLQLPLSTVAALPTCNSTNKALMYAVSDATSPTYNGALTGGGTVSVPVYCNGSTWTAH